MRLVKNLVGGIVIMIVATIIGIAQNTTRSKPLPLILDAPRPSHATPAHEPGTMTPEEAGLAPVINDDRDITEEELSIARLAKERVHALLGTHKITLVDARDAHEFEKGHLPGAVNVPYNNFVEYYDRLMDYVPTDGVVVVYCTSYDCDLGDKLIQELQLAGYEKLMLYPGGWDEWSEAGLPTEEIPEDERSAAPHDHEH